MAHEKYLFLVSFWHNKCDDHLLGPLDNPPDSYVNVFEILPGTYPSFKDQIRGFAYDHARIKQPDISQDQVVIRGVWVMWSEELCSSDLSGMDRVRLQNHLDIISIRGKKDILFVEYRITA